MKRKALIIIILGILVTIVFTFVASADSPAPGGPFNTAFRVQNLSSATTNCVYSFYNSSGVAILTSSPATISPGDSMYVYVPALGSVPSGVYSAVVSCDQEVAAVINFSDSDSGASHRAIASPGTVWYAPGIYDNYYSYYSNIIVQNATASTADITVEIYAPGGSSPVVTQSQVDVPGYASVSFEQEGLAGLNTNVPYSAKITSTGDVAPIVNMYGRGGVDNQLYSYNPLSTGSTTAYAPVLMNNYYGYTTSLTVQNIGTSSTHVTVTYGSGGTWEGDIQANTSQVLYTPVSGIPGGTLTSAVVESTDAGSGAQPIIALVNESNGYNRAASYAGFASGTTSVSAPIVMRRYYQYNTSVTCQNIGSSSVVMTLEYGGIGGTNTSPSIPPGGTHMFYQPDDSLIPDNFIGSATITASESIVCVINEDQNEGAPATTSMDQLYAYEGINK